MKLTCPQCRNTEFIPIGTTDMRRCSSCRWLFKLQSDGTLITAFTLTEPKKRDTGNYTRFGKGQYKGKRGIRKD